MAIRLRASVCEVGSGNPVSARKNRWFMFATLIGMALIMEGLSWMFFARFGARFHLPDPSQYVASERELQRIDAVHDPDVGWRNRYETPFGERPRGHHYGVPWIATFGDSFTHGDEVDDHETWSEQLAGLLAVDVYNFGAGAYGMDQALLRFEREIHHRPVRSALFSFISEDIRRNVSVYWKFRQPSSRFPLTKPRFLLRDGALELLPKAGATAEALRTGLRDPAFIHQMGLHDWWFNRYGLPRAHPPYVRMFFTRGFWQAVAGRRSGEDLWALDEPVALTRQILIRFVRGATAQGVRPIIMHLPVLREVRQLALVDQEPLAVHHTRAVCQELQVTCLYPLAAMLETVPRPAALFVHGVKGGHYNAAGHRWLAEYLARQVDWQVPPAADTDTR